LTKSLRIILAAVLVLLLALAAGCGKSSNVAATVNGEEITKQQLDEMVQSMKQYYQSMGLTIDENKDTEMVKMINSMTLEQLIDQTLLLQEAKKMGIQVPKADIDKEIDGYKKSMTEDKFKQQLAANGWTEPKFRDMLEKDMTIAKLTEKILADVKPATEPQAAEYYEKNKQQFVVPASYEVRHILIMTQGKQGDQAKIDLEAKTKALAVLEKVNKGGDFAELAKQNSEDPGSAPEGGLYTFSPGQAVPEFESAVKSLQPGGITKAPVKTEFGYHLIKLEKVTPEAQKNFAEVKDQIVASLSEQAKQEKQNQFIEEARKKAKIVNNLDKPEDQKPGK